MPYKYRQNYTKFSIAAQGKGQSIQVGKKKKAMAKYITQNYADCNNKINSIR